MLLFDTFVPAIVKCLQCLSEASLKKNFTEERPTWQLSVYGPAKEEPNLVVGVDRSPEEDRMLYYMSMRSTGNASQYVCIHISCHYTRVNRFVLLL